MAVLRAKEVQKMKKDEREKKILDLNLELIKSKVSASKGGSAKTKEIKKAIARLLTANVSDKKIIVNKTNKK